MSRSSTDPGILFDLDGTLVDTVYQHVLAWSIAIESAGMSVPAHRTYTVLNGEISGQ